MFVTEVQPINPKCARKESFDIESNATSEQVHNPDDAQHIVRPSPEAPSLARTGYKKTYNRLTMLTMKSRFLLLGQTR